MAVIERTVVVRASLPQALRLINRVPSIVSGHSTLAASPQRQLQIRLGLAALDRIRLAFVKKARGETDEAGGRWAPLKPETIAYSRRHPGVPPKKTRAKYAPSWMLTKKQRERWWSLYGSFVARYGSSPDGKSHAAAVAWIISKEEGATTLLKTYGGEKVEILRDTGILLNSLSPRVPPEAAPPTAPRQPLQVFRLLKGVVEVGTRRKYAGTHHRGIPGRLPQRRLWPEPSRWPASWWGRLLTQARAGVIDVILSLLGKV
jgi:hypothetical protein